MRCSAQLDFGLGADSDFGAVQQMEVLRTGTVRAPNRFTKGAISLLNFAQRFIKYPCA